MLRRAVAPSALALCVGTHQSRSIYEYKFGQPPLTAPFGGTKAAPPSPTAPVKEEEVKVTKLHNGVRIISQQMGSPLVSVGAYILAGPVYDPANCPGVGAMMHLALTTSHYNSSLFQLDRRTRSIGASDSHFELFKHYIGIRVTCRAEKWRAASGQAPSAGPSHSAASQKQDELSFVQDKIFASISAPRFHEPDIERFRDTIDSQLKEMRWQYPAQYAQQMLETVAFYREPLGNPRFVPEDNNSNISSKVLLDQYSKYVIPSRVVIAGVNLSHDELVAEYENTPFPHSASAPHHAKAAAESKDAPVDVRNEQRQYVGGERQDHEDRAKEMGTKPDMDSETICAVGWLAYGRDRTMLKDYAASLVFQNLLDMELKDGVRYSRDETYVHQGVRSFYNPYQTAGLMGFTVTAEPQNAVKMTTESVEMVQRKAAAPTEAEVGIAKQRAITRFYNDHSLDSRDYCDFLGTSLSLDASQTTPTSLSEVIDAVMSISAADVKKVGDLMFSKPASFYGHGEMLGFPSKRQMGL